MCVVTVYGDTPLSACTLMFCLSWELLQTFLWGGCVFPPANDSVRLRAPRLDAVQTAGSYRCGHAAKKS